MKRNITFDRTDIEERDMEEIIQILPEIKEYFTDSDISFRCCFYPTIVTLTLNTLDKLSENFTVELTYDTLIIKFD